MRKALAVAGVLCLIFVISIRANEQNKKATPILAEASHACSVVSGDHDDWKWTVGECHKRETARLFLAMGQDKAALAVLCSTQAATQAKACQQ